MRINSSQMNVDTQFAPLDELTQIISVDRRPLSQWYDAQNGTYLPDRTTNPLTLRPVVQATDPDTQKKYSPTFVTVIWYQREGNGSEQQITNTVESQNAPYTVKATGDLVVRKNVTNAAPVTLRCVIIYRDPRMAVNVQTEAQVVLTTNVDSSARYDVYIQTPKVVEFNPLSGETSSKTITAKATLGEEDATSSVIFEWYALDRGHSSEMKIDNTDDPFICYVSGQGTASLVIDALYCDNLTVICRIKKSASASLEPCRDTVSVLWKVPSIDAVIQGDNGAMARETIDTMNFTVNYNAAQGIGTLSDEVIANNFAIRWQKRNSTGGYSFVSWGREVLMSGGDMRTTNMTSTLMQAETFLRSEYVAVVQGSSVVTQDGKIVCCRKIE